MTLNRSLLTILPCLPFFREATIIGALMATAILSGCAKKEEDGLPWAVRETCIKGVVYYYSGYQLAAALKQDGSPYLCQMPNK